MATTNILLCGLGGQGLLFMTKVLAGAALGRGYNLLGAETHGMAQRGGSVVSHLRIGPVQGSLVMSGAADFLLALDPDEAYRNLSFLAERASVYVNADPERFPIPEVKAFLDKRAITCRSVSSDRIAREQGSPRSSNLALLGYFSAFADEPVGREDLRASVESTGPERFRDVNLRIFDGGFEQGEKDRG